MTNRAFKFRIYPNVKQEELFRKTVGCARFVYNQMLLIQQENYKDGRKYMSKIAANTYCNQVMKNEYPWLREVDKFALTNSIFHLDAAFRRFFQKAGGYPKFKSKHSSRQSYTTNYTNGNIKVLEACGQIRLPKMGKIRARIHRAIPEKCRIKSATVSFTSDRRFMFCFGRI